jgi:hypothetical protein
MARFEVPYEVGSEGAPVAGMQPRLQRATRDLNCPQCDHPLECVEHHLRSGTWLGSFFCPNCRGEYFYTYRWGRLMPKG